MQMALDRRTLLQTTGATAVAAAVLPRGLGAIAQDATPPATAPTGELIIGKGQEAVGLDPAMVTATASFQLFAPVYQQLVRFDADNQPQPSLADSWEATDETTYVFNLHPGVVFHNGKTLTA
jgi:ABC-type transport system substrate-binding protein